MVDVDTTLACTRAHAHFSRAHLTRDDCTNGSGPRGSRLLSLLLVLFPWLLLLLLILCHDPQPRQLLCTGTKSLPCVSVRWSGLSGCIANPTPDTGLEPKFCVDTNDEHTPIKLPDGNGSFPHITATSEDPDVPRHSGTSGSGSKHTAAAIGVPTVLGSLGTCTWKQLADCESVDSRNSIRETDADLDRETVVSTLFSSEMNGNRDRD